MKYTQTVVGNVMSRDYNDVYYCITHRYYIRGGR